MGRLGATPDPVDRSRRAGGLCRPARRWRLLRRRNGTIEDQPMLQGTMTRRCSVAHLSLTLSMYSRIWPIPTIWARVRRRPFTRMSGCRSARSSVPHRCFQDIDFGSSICGYYNCPGGANHQSRFWQDQFSSLYALVDERHELLPRAAGDRSPSKPAWVCSSTRATPFPSRKTMGRMRSGWDAGNNSASHILNTWKPQLNKAVSDLQRQAPVYRERGGQAAVWPRWTEVSGPTTAGWWTRSMGGWQISAIYRMTSGLPTSFSELAYDTNYQYTSYARGDEQDGPQQEEIPGLEPAIRSTSIDPQHDPQWWLIRAVLFVRRTPARPASATISIGDGYLDLDSGVSKVVEAGAVWEGHILVGGL